MTLTAPSILPLPYAFFIKAATFPVGSVYQSWLSPLKSI